MIEIWRNVVGYEGLYEVSNWGRVKRLAGKGCRQERILKLNKVSNGYLTVGLHKNGNRKQCYVHRLVGMTFPDLVDWTEDAKGRPFEELTVNHKSEFEKANNHVSNLQWCPLDYNLKYGTHYERAAKANTNGKCSKRVGQYTLDDELVKIWPSVMEVERQTGWRQPNISACCRGKYKQSYGYLWRYK